MLSTTSSVIGGFLQRWLVTTLAVLVAAHVVAGLAYDSVAGLCAASLLLGVLNAFVRPIMMLVSLPLLVSTLGLFLWVINAGLLYLVGQIVRGFRVESFSAAFWGALVISIVSIGANFLIGRPKAASAPRRGPGRPPNSSPGGQGPIIDV
jgi:putative membrane protein